MKELTAAAPPGPPAFVAIPGHPGFCSDTPIIAGMLLEPAWREAAGFMQRRVRIRIEAPDVEAPREPLAIESGIVHDPVRVPMMLPVSGRRAVAAQ